ncbi:MAG: 30S ribosomal protein S3 [Candidatus Thermoplasmatota archaeon]|nr:30S ribosomal protein S3 [Candidatus Thermoplasmatota archaeon]MBS3789869.1 30S ribosomal protein S3 [Candidatus Thermoplasmatota archaeon]
MARERKFINEKMDRVILKEFLQERTERAGFGGADISRTPMGTRITLYTERPALVIGRKGKRIREITEEIKDKFEFDNPQIEVQEVETPQLNAQIMAEKLASSLERGWYFRRAGHSTVRKIMDGGAKGCQIILSGKVSGPRHRVEKFQDGHIKYCGEERKKWMDEGFAQAKLKLGIIGVTVKIMDPNAKLPDEIEIIPPESEKEEGGTSEDEEEGEKKEEKSEDQEEEKEPEEEIEEMEIEEEDEVEEPEEEMETEEEDEVEEEEVE